MKGHQQQAVHSELAQVVQAGREAAEIADAIPIAVVESGDVQLIGDAVVVPVSFASIDLLL